MAKTYPVIERAGGRITVLARTAEEAHDAVTRELGGSCTIVSVERVRSGGLGGFFATELVRLVAAPRRSEAAVADTATFASAEELVFALPGGGGQFAARLKEELAALTTKGTAAAEATMGRTAPEPLPNRSDEQTRQRRRRRLDDERDELDDQAEPSFSWAGITEPVDTVVTPTPRIEAEIEPILPSSDELHWGAVDERGSFEGDDALLAAWTEVEAHVDDPIHHEPSYADSWSEVPAPEPIVDAAQFSPVVTPSDPDLELIAEMLASELELGDERAITPRARLIRGGPRSVVDASSVEFPGDTTPTDEVTSPAESIAAEPVMIEPSNLEPSTFESATYEPEAVEPAAPIAPPREVYEAPIDRLLAAEQRSPLPVRHRVLVPTPVSPAGAWSAPTLRAFGVPDGIVERMAAQTPGDDLEWTVAFMLAVRDLCRELPSGPSVLVGPSGANLARQLGLMSCSGDELGISALSVASPNAGPVTLRRAAGGRHVHLVVGGNWHHLVTVRPTIVSAATEHDLLEALRVAEAWGATLGWTLDGDRYIRIDPYLLAGRVRRLLPDRAEMSSVLSPSLFPSID